MNEPDEVSEPELFERELEAALERVAPPEGFAERVLARAYPASASPGWSSGRPFPVTPPRLWLAVAAFLLVAVLGLFGEQHHTREVRRREARARFDMSMAITRQTLAEVGLDTRKQLSAAGIQLAP